jgi:hypothetical protein
MNGITTIPADDYHRDPADVPSLSASIAHILCTSSPWHAWTAHPRLNPDWRRVDEQKFDVGTVAHALLLEGEAAIEAVDAADWRTAAAKDARDAARAAHKTPLLVHQLAEVQAMVTAAREQLAAHDATPEPFTDGLPEQTVMWEDRGVTCRSRVDWLHHDYTIDDYKTTGRSAHPEAYSRALFQVGGDIQAAFYLRAVQSLDPEAVPYFRWIVQETFPPYALSVIAPDPGVLLIGDKKVQYALDKWRACLGSDDWPGYPAEVAYAELPVWEEQRWLEREERELAA